MHDYINIWCAVMVNDMFHELSTVDNDETNWQIRCALDLIIDDPDHCADAGRHDFILDRYKHELGSVRELSFSTRYYFRSFVEKLTILSENVMFLYCVRER